MDLVLFAIIGAMINVNAWYWVAYGVYATYLFSCFFVDIDKNRNKGSLNE